MHVTEGEYKGKPILQIFQTDNDQRPVVSFGLRKARAIIACGEERIRAFVDKHDRAEAKTTASAPADDDLPF